MPNAGYRPAATGPQATYISPGRRFTREVAQPRASAALASKLKCAGWVNRHRQGEFSCDAQGFVLLKVGNAILECRILGWAANEVSFVVPDMGLAQATAADLQVVRPTGTIVKAYPIQLVTKPELIVEEDPAPSPVPGQTAPEQIVSNERAGFGHGPEQRSADVRQHRRRISSGAVP